MSGIGKFPNLFGPVLDTYNDAAVGLTGCRSMAREREACEYDLILVRQERNPSSTLKIGENFVDLTFSTESDLLRQKNPEAALSLAFAKPIRDKDLTLSPCISEARETLERNYQRCAEERLTSALKGIGRADQALSKGSKQDADFWLMSAGYDFAYAWLEASKMVPSPSHLLSQVRQISRGQPGKFEAFSSATGLRSASRRSCESRLEALALVYDLIGTTIDEGASRGSVKTAFELLSRKSEAALKTSQPADSYCFLGLEISRTLPQILVDRVGGRGRHSVISTVPAGENPLLAETVVKELGIGVMTDSLEKTLAALKVQVSLLARKA